LRIGNEPLLDFIHQKRRTDPFALAGGIFGVMMVLGVLIALPVIATAGSAPASSGEGTEEPFEYIEARLLKWGEIKDPEALPDRIVPALPTAPEDVLPLDRNAEKKEPEKKVEKPKRQAGAAVDDKLRKVFEKARAFAEVQDDFIPEGHPDGVPDGDVTDPALASMGATYGHRINRIFLERWVVPTLLSEKVKDQSKVKVLIRVDINMIITDVKFLKKSGNAMFDNSVQTAIDRVRQEVRTLPAPPEALASKIFGGGIVLKFNGSDAEYE
jgi:outer membrane biosynthesis protein TonB